MPETTKAAVVQKLDTDLSLDDTPVAVATDKGIGNVSSVGDTLVHATKTLDFAERRQVRSAVIADKLDNFNIVLAHTEKGQHVQSTKLI